MKKLTLMLSMLLVAAVSTTADAAKNKGKAKAKAAAPAVVSMDATDAQRTKFFQDALNPMGAK